MSSAPEHFGASMVKASIKADLGHLLLAAIPDMRDRERIEEAFANTAHDMFIAGQTVGEGNLAEAEGRAYFRGMFDTVGMFTGEIFDEGGE